MSLAMTKDERETFLAGLHVGVLSVQADGRGPLSAPIWYAYEPGGDVVMLSGVNAPKTAAMRKAGRATLVAQSEALPYAYVAVEGSLTFEPAPADVNKAIAVRYLGEKLGAQYAEGSTEGASVLVRLRPEHWRSEDYGKR